MLTFVSEAEREGILAYFFKRFGIPPEAFRGHRFLQRGGTIWVAADAPGLAEALEALKIETAGIPLLRTRLGPGRSEGLALSRVEGMPNWKPTTAGLQIFGRFATRNVIDLDDKALEAFLRQGVVQGDFPVEAGYVIVRWKGKVLGCGLYGKGGLRSQIPSEWWRQVRRTSMLDVG